MFLVFKKKNIVLITSALLLGIGCYLGLNKFNDHSQMAMQKVNSEQDEEIALPPGEPLAVMANENYFVKSKNDKELIRSKATEILRRVIDDPSSSPDAKIEAENSIIAIANDMNKEINIESILSAKGFNENVVFISDGITTVSLKGNKLSSKEVAQINDIVSEITGNNNIKIVEVK